MNDQPRHYRSDVRDFVSDLMQFIKWQIGRAIDDPNDQWSATIAASGVVPVIRARLVPDHEALWASLGLLSKYLVGSGNDLVSLGALPRDEFMTEAIKLRKLIDIAQNELLS
jgi:hypothetical protein